MLDNTNGRYTWYQLPGRVHNMCILALSINDQTSNYPFICIQNRDEDLTRHSLPPNDGLSPTNLWNDNKYHPIIGGKDSRSQGTWFGFNRETGMFTALNNFRSRDYPDPVPEIGKSRGQLVLQHLDNPPPYLMEPADKAPKSVLWHLNNEYPGFNLVAGNLYQRDRPSIFFTTNRPATHVGKQDIVIPRTTGIPDTVNSVAHSIQISPGTYSVSNSYFDDGRWPKVRYLREELATVANKYNGLSSQTTLEQEVTTVKDMVTELATPLTYTGSFPDYPEDLSFSPLTYEKELANQKVFIEHDRGKPIYPLEHSGTCSQSIIVKGQRAVHFWYRSMYEYPDIGEWTSFVVPF